MRTLALVLLLAAQAADVPFTKGLRQHTLDGKKVDTTMTVAASGLTIERKKQPRLVLSWADVTGITYDRRRRVRKMAPNWGDAEDHFVTIKYKLPAGADFIEIEAEKDVAPKLVNTLEARSGLKIERVGA